MDVSTVLGSLGWVLMILGGFGLLSNPLVGAIGFIGGGVLVGMSHLMDGQKKSGKGSSSIQNGGQEISSIQSKEPSDLSSSDLQKIDIYVELEKLDSLRQRGVLTEDEFVSEKKKLLDAKR